MEKVKDKSTIWKSKIISILLIFIFLVGCSADKSSEEIKAVVCLEKNNHKLWNFDITYDEYKENIKGILDESSINKDEEVVFGYNDKKYYGKDLIGVDMDTMKKYKEDFFTRFKLFDLSTIKLEIKITDVYNNEQTNDKEVFTVVKQTANTINDIFTTYIISKYSFEKIDGDWLIYKEEKINYDNDKMIEIYNADCFNYDNIDVEFIKKINPLN